MKLLLLILLHILPNGSDSAIALLLNQDTSIFHFANDSSSLLQINQLANDTVKKGYLIARSTEALVKNIRYGELIEEIPTAQVLRKAFVQHEKELENQESLKGLNQVKVHPNPAKNGLVIDYKFEETAPSGLFQVYDLTGKLIEAKLLYGNQGKNVLDVSRVNSGIYFYLVTTNNNTIAREKLIIIK